MAIRSSTTVMATTAMGSSSPTRTPILQIAPWFLAGSLFPITAMPVGMTWVARFLPLTHALAVMRYGLLGDQSGLHNIWRTNDVHLVATPSLAVVIGFALLLTAAGVRTFTRAAMR